MPQLMLTSPMQGTLVRDLSYPILHNHREMRFGFISSCPLHLVPLLIFFPGPSHTFPFLFSFISSCLHVLDLIPSFVCAHQGPGLSMYVHIHIHFKPRFQVAQVLTMRWGSSFVPLVSISSQPRTFCPVCPLSLVFIFFVPAARTHAQLTFSAS